jgi:hypothetical protein
VPQDKAIERILFQDRHEHPTTQKDSKWLHATQKSPSGHALFIPITLYPKPLIIPIEGRQVNATPMKQVNARPGPSNFKYFNYSI